MAVLIIVPMFMTRPFQINVLILSAIWAIMGIGWNFIGGYTGQVSNGHAMFYAIGAYVGALSLKWFQISPWISMWFGVIISMVVAAIIGLPLFRLRGHYFAIATMALVECTRVVFLNWNWIGGSTGVSYFEKGMSEWYTLQFVAKRPFYYVALGFMAIFVILTKVMEKTKFGYYCRAIKANQESAESSGVDAARYKLIAYMISAGIVSIGGALYAQYIQYIDPRRPPAPEQLDADRPGLRHGWHRYRLGSCARRIPHDRDQRVFPFVLRQVQRLEPGHLRRPGHFHCPLHPPTA